MEASSTNIEAKRLAVIALIPIAMMSLLMDEGIHVLLSGHGPTWVVDLYLPSFVVSAALYFLTDPEKSWKLPTRNETEHAAIPVRKRIALVGAWLGSAALGCTILALFRGHAGLIAGIALMGTHMLAQVFLFEGALFQLVRRLTGELTAAACVAVLGALSQIQYDHGVVNGPVLFQMFKALVLVFAFCALRISMKSIWPAIAARAVVNLLGVV